ncbi:hypothetical protein EDD18DRAFT_1202390 [Armillaria luteobubalina]|uniref:Uncharacterized protein n=1 Tax=Armillaria luteobubalina TaxID=153913 RepID=A0AA39UK00_9AGAR|nr:hypothetical protein EDD18DRAFT_1202390 [Armillaria luteobubalina]
MGLLLAAVPLMQSLELFQDVCVRVHNLVTACGYKDPSPQMLALRISTDLVFSSSSDTAHFRARDIPFFQITSLLRENRY